MKKLILKTIMALFLGLSANASNNIRIDTTSSIKINFKIFKRQTTLSLSFLIKKDKDKKNFFSKNFNQVDSTENKKPSVGKNRLDSKKQEKITAVGDSVQNNNEEQSAYKVIERDSVINDTIWGPPIVYVFRQGQGNDTLKKNREFSVVQKKISIVDTIFIDNKRDSTRISELSKHKNLSNDDRSNKKDIRSWVVYPAVVITSPLIITGLAVFSIYKIIKGDWKMKVTLKSISTKKRFSKYRKRNQKYFNKNTVKCSRSW